MAISAVRIILLYVVAFGVLLVTAVSLLPIDHRLKFHTQPSRRTTAVVARRNHRIVHWIAFASLSFLLTLLCRNFAQRFMGLTGLVAVGALIEWLQHIIYSGRLETSDIFDDGYGAFAGFAAAMLTLWANHKGLLSKPIRVA